MSQHPTSHRQHLSSPESLPGTSPSEDGGDLRGERSGGGVWGGGGWRRGIRLLALALAFVLLPASQGDTQISDVHFEMQRRRMVEHQIMRRGIKDSDVLEAMGKVPRHRFVPSIYVTRAYEDRALPIGKEQTISQPYIVARMTELLELTRSSKVLEIGTGSGYHAAVLSQVAGEVYTIEIVESLGEIARERLEDLGYRNVHVRIGDGFRGWPEEAPFDAIILTAAPAELPPPLLDQLKVGGKIVLPQGSGQIQDLLVLTKTRETLERQRVAAVRFVPMTGEASKQRD